MKYIITPIELFKSQVKVKKLEKDYQEAKKIYEEAQLLHSTQELAFKLQQILVRHKVQEVRYVGYLNQHVQINAMQRLDPGHYFDFRSKEDNIEFTNIDFKVAAYIGRSPTKQSLAEKQYEIYERRLDTKYQEFSELLDELNAFFNNTDNLGPPGSKLVSRMLSIKDKPFTSDIESIMSVFLPKEDYDNWLIAYQRHNLQKSIPFHTQAVSQINQIEPTRPEKFKNKVAIEGWLRNHHVANYEILSDLRVEVKGSVYFDLRYKDFNPDNYLPVQFSTVSGDFVCAHQGLKSLDGCPDIVKGKFDCTGNKLTNLNGGPKEVGADYVASKNPLTHLEELPLSVGNNFLLTNTKLLNVPRITTKVGTYMYISHHLEQKIPEFEKFYKDKATALILSGPELEVLRENNILQKEVEVLPYSNSKDASILKKKHKI